MIGHRNNYYELLFPFHFIFPSSFSVPCFPFHFQFIFTSFHFRFHENKNDSDTTSTPIAKRCPSTTAVAKPMRGTVIGATSTCILDHSFQYQEKRRPVKPPVAVDQEIMHVGLASPARPMGWLTDSQADRQADSQVNGHEGRRAAKPQAIGQAGSRAGIML